MFQELEKALEKVKTTQVRRDEVYRKNTDAMNKLKDEISALDNELQSAVDEAHDKASQVQNELSGILPGFGGGRTRR